MSQKHTTPYFLYTYFQPNALIMIITIPLSCYKEKMR